jgi:hypothetical protein
MSSPVAANDGYEHLDAIAFQFGLACLSIYFQEGILLPQVPAWIIKTGIRVFGISTTKRFEKGLQDKPDLGFASLFWLSTFSVYLLSQRQTFCSFGLVAYALPRPISHKGNMEHGMPPFFSAWVFSLGRTKCDIHVAA